MSDVGVDPIFRVAFGNARDTPETVNALKVWLKKKDLEVLSIDHVNTGLDCFYWAMKFAIARDLKDTFTRTEITNDELFHMDINELREMVVEYADFVRDPVHHADGTSQKHPDSDAMTVR